MKAQNFDALGALTLAASLAGLLLAITQSRNHGWSSANVVAPALFAALCLCAFIITEKRASAPVIELKLFRRPPFVIANFLAVVANGTRFAVGLLVPYYVIEVLRYPATWGGTLMLAAAVMTPLAAPVAGRMSDRYGTAGLSALGLIVQGFGLWLISGLGAGSDYVTIAFALGVVGLGLGVFEAPNMSFIMGAIARTQQGVAGGISNMMRTLGIVIGATGWSMLFDARRHFYSSELGISGAAAAQAFVPAFQDVFLCAATICAAAFILALFRRQ